MAQEPYNPVTASSIKMIVEIAMNDNGCFHGIIDCKYYKEPFAFTNTMELIDIMDTTFDNKGYPESQLLLRTFTRARKRMNSKKVDLNKHLGDKVSGRVGSHHKPPSGTNTFEISVRHRNNAEWQGTAYWVENDEKKEFLSVLEMIKFIDESLT